MLSDENRFVSEMLSEMKSPESKHKYRRLAESIYEALAERAGKKAKGGDAATVIEEMEKLIEDDKVLYAIIKRKRPRFTDEQLNLTVKAFRKAYDFGDFEKVEERVFGE